MTRPGSRVTYQPLVVRKDIPALDSAVAARVRLAIETKLFLEPEAYGEPLRGALKHYWKLRVGDWRIIYEIIRPEVRILVIAHRSVVYKLIEKRI